MTNSIDRMLDHILFLARRFHIGDAEYIAKIVVLELGVLPKYDGYRYLVKAIMLHLDSPVQITIKNLYSELESYYDGAVDVEQIEQSIRSAIKQAWKKRNDKIWCCYFSYDAKGIIEKPSNGDFISTVACVVDLWKGWCHYYEKSMCPEEDVL